MLNKYIRQLPVLAALAITAGTSNAAVEFSGFASAGFITGDLDTPFVSGPDRVSESSSFGADNTIGVQVASRINDQVNVAAQLLGKGTLDSYSISAQWAYISYEFSPDLSARIGRLNFPAALFSEYQEIGFNYPWVRNPMEVYTTVPLSTYSGMDLVYSFDSGDINWQILPFIGSSPTIELASGSGGVELAYGITLVVNTDNAKLNFMAVNADEADFDVTVGGVLLNFNMDMSYYSAGIEYEKNNILLISEIIKKDIHNNPQSSYQSISDMTAYYVTLGYRMGDFLPHFTYAGTQSDHSATILPAGSPFPGIDPALWVAPEDMIIPTNGELYLQESYTLGLRYDFSSQAAIKLDYQRVIPEDGSWGVFFNDPGDKVDLLSFVVDIVF